LFTFHISKNLIPWYSEFTGNV